MIWLLWSKRLFGLNGGGKAYREEHEAESLLSVESAGPERNRRQRNGITDSDREAGLVLQRVGDRVGAVLHAELGQDRLDMVTNGLGADVQFGGDLGVAQPGGKQIEDLALTPGQRVRVRQPCPPAGSGVPARAAAARRC